VNTTFAIATTLLTLDMLTNWTEKVMSSLNNPLSLIVQIVLLLSISAFTVLALGNIQAIFAQLALKRNYGAAYAYIVDPGLAKSLKSSLREMTIIEVQDPDANRVAFLVSLGVISTGLFVYGIVKLLM